MNALTLARILLAWLTAALRRLLYAAVFGGLARRDDLSAWEWSK